MYICTCTYTKCLRTSDTSGHEVILHAKINRKENE